MRALRWWMTGLAAVALGGCGEKCEALCQDVGQKVANCKPPSLTWNDLGARSRADFVNQCRQQWSRERLNLSATDLRLALEACRDTSQEVTTLTCEEVIALYGPED